MVYNLTKVAVRYTKGYKDFIVKKGIGDWSIERLYNLISYAVCKMYGLDTRPYAQGTASYGRSCAVYLSSLKGTPRRREQINMATKVDLLSMTQAYFVAYMLVGCKTGEVVEDVCEDALG